MGLDFEQRDLGKLRVPVPQRGYPGRHEIGSGEKPFGLGPITGDQRDTGPLGGPAASSALRGVKSAVK
jgi:hypothetical protein